MTDYENYMYTPSCPLCKFFGDESGICEKCKHRKTYLKEKEKMMTDDELRNYLDGESDKQAVMLPCDADQLISSYTIERLDKLSEQLSSIITLLKYIAEDVRKNG